jgi:hypothetical protein
MHRDTELKCLTNICRLDALSDAAPECCIQKDDVDTNVEDVFRKLFENLRLLCWLQRHSNFLSTRPHPM